MKIIFQLSFSGLLALALWLSGCASMSTNNVRLADIKGRMELETGVLDANEISQPATEVLSRGSAFLFSPVEFQGHRVKLGLEEVTSPLGRNVALRQAGAGLLNDIKPGQAKFFNVRYQVSFDTLQQAKDQFQGLSDEHFVEINENGKKKVEVTNWKFRFVMLFSSDRNSFRVMIDDIQYYHPSTEFDEDSQQEDHEKNGRVPVLISFAYLYPDHVKHIMRQTNVVFDYLIKLDDGQYLGKPRFSNWIPVQDNADSEPYSIEIAVAEIRKKEEFFSKIPEWIKSVRNLF